nr:membrane metallo-endopeptidase-like 1 [Dermacentor andersoni]
MRTVRRTTRDCLSSIRNEDTLKESRDEAPGSAGRKDSNYTTPSRRADSELLATTTTVPDRSATAATSCGPANEPTNPLLALSPIKFTNISENNPFKKSVVGFLAAAVIVTVMVAVIGLAISRHEHTKREIYCETEGCLLHARLLTKDLNKTIDPCEDFSAYVCSAWSRSGDYREQVKTPIDGILYNRGNTSFENFRRLMKVMNLSWPENPGKNVNALGVMLSLSYKWHITIWIAVSGKEAYWRLGIGPSEYIPLPKNHYASVRSSGGYPQYWNGYYHALRTSASQPLDKPAIDRFADAEGDILGRLLSPLAATEKHSAVVPIASMGNVTASLSPSTCLEQLNLHPDLGPKVAADDRVLVSDTAFLAAFGDLFARYSHQQLLSHLSWLFVQTYAPILDRKLHLARFGDSEKANLYKPIFCAFHVESTFKILVFALNYVSGFTQSDRNTVTTAFGRLMSAGVRELNSSTWLDEECETSAAEKLASVQVILWPGQLWLGNEFLRTLYSDFPINETSFGDYWMKTRLAIAKKNRTVNFEATLRLPSNFPPPTYRYDYIRNNIEIPIGTVDKPLFYKDATKAMFYGGFGLLIALEMVRALDKIGLHCNEDGRETTSILSERSIKYFEEKNACLKDEGSISIFPEVPAVEIAYAALSDAIREDKDALTIRDLPEEKVFMTLCYMMCKEREANRFGGVDSHKVIPTP